MSLQLKEFILSHDDWEELLSNEPYCLKITRDDGFIMFKYNQLSSDFTIPLVREARGIIFKEETWVCVCRGFDKFGNYGEEYCPFIDWSTVSVQEKVDGSLIKVWQDPETKQWRVSTNGTIDAYKAPLTNSLKLGEPRTYGDLFESAVKQYIDWTCFTSKLFGGITYLFELVSPYNRVVIPYERTDVFFLGGRYTEGIASSQVEDEILPEKLKISQYIHYPKRYDLHTLEDVMISAKKLPWNEEGYVVCDEKFNRVKIKSPEYVVAHYARTNNCISLEHLIKIVLNNEQKEFLIYASDYEEELKRVEQAMHKIAEDSVKALKEVWGVTSTLSRKEYAEEINKKPHYAKDFLFHCCDEKIFFDYARSWNESKWAKVIEPLFNAKDGEKENECTTERTAK